MLRHSEHEPPPCVPQIQFCSNSALKRHLTDNHDSRKARQILQIAHNIEEHSLHLNCELGRPNLGNERGRINVQNRDAVFLYSWVLQKGRYVVYETMEGVQAVDQIPIVCSLAV